jgi:hypothetical protein
VRYCIDDGSKAPVRSMSAVMCCACGFEVVACACGLY